MLAALAGLGRTARAQRAPAAPPTADTIRGRILGPDSQPAYGALIVVTPLRGGEPQRATTNSEGDYTILIPGRADAYDVTIRALGFAPLTLRVTRASAAGALVGDATLTDVRRLDPVVVHAQRPRPRVSRGSSALTAASQTYGHPDPMEDMSDPWLRLDPTRLAVPGMDATDNRMALNGVTVQTVLPPAASSGANALVVTNSSDPSKGGFGGGQVTYDITALGVAFHWYKLHLFLAPARLNWTDRTSSAIGPASSTLNGALEFENPLFGSVRHKTMLSVAHTDGPLPQLPRTAAGLARYGLTSDAVDRFTTVVDSLGIAHAITSRPAAQATRQLAWVTTLDGGRRDSGATYRVTLNAGETVSENVGASPLALASHDGLSRQQGLVAIGTVQRDIGNGFLATLTGALNRYTTRTEPYAALPQGQVRLGDTTLNWLTFGGNSSLGGGTELLSWQAKSALQWHSLDKQHLFELGAGLRREQSRVMSAQNTRGQFEFASLADLAAGHATRFTRVLDAPPQTSAGTSLEAYWSDTWRPQPRLAVQYGLRLDGFRPGLRPAYNAAVDSAFGRRTDIVPQAIALSPRLGFTRYYGWKGPWRPGIRMNALQLTVGRYQSTMTAGEVAAVAQRTGLPSALRLLECVGEAVPPPQWEAYAADADAIPAVCADGGSAQPQAFTAPHVQLFDRRYAPPTRQSIDLTWQNWQRVPLTARLSFSRTTQRSAIDLNLRRAPQFTLPLEGDRPVYVAPAAIVPGTGAAALENGRVDPRFGPVLLSVSDLTSEAVALSVAKRIALPFGTSLSARYQYLRGHSETRGFDDVTPGDPFDPFGASRGPLRLPRHTLALGGRWQRMRIDREVEVEALSVNLFVALRSGTPYTPRIAQDITGNGRANDAAFLFDPAATPSSAVADGMTALLQGAPRAARQCLATQLGRIAGPNSCVGPWSVSADMQVSYTFPGPRAASLRVDLPNVAGLLDQVLHGQARRGWGDVTFADPTLLVVTGFDPATRQYQYQVNRNFGRGNPIHAPFALRLRVSVPVGPSEEGQQAREYARRIRVAREQGRDIVRAFLPFPNPFAQLTLMHEGLELTSEQATAIRTAEAQWQREVDSVGAALNRYMATARPGTPDTELLLTLRRAGREITALTLKWAQPIREQLSSDQLAKLEPQLRYWFTGRREAPEVSGF